VELGGRVALVTGAGRRVGRAIALALAAKAMRVAVHYNASAREADETVRLARAAGAADAWTISADLRDPAAITVFKSVGLAIQDLAAAELVMANLLRAEAPKP